MSRTETPDERIGIAEAWRQLRFNARALLCETLIGWAQSVCPVGYVPSYAEALNDAYDRGRGTLDCDGTKAIHGNCPTCGLPSYVFDGVPGLVDYCPTCEWLKRSGAGAPVLKNEVADGVWRNWPMAGQTRDTPNDHALVEIRRPEREKSSIIRPGEDPYLNVCGLMWRPVVRQPLKEVSHGI